MTRSQLVLTGATTVNNTATTKPAVARAIGPSMTAG